MSVNIPNYLLCKILDKDEELYEIADKISYFKPSKELNGYAEMFITPSRRRPILQNALAFKDGMNSGF